MVLECDVALIGMVEGLARLDYSVDCADKVEVLVERALRLYVFAQRCSESLGGGELRYSASMRW